MELQRVLIQGDPEQNSDVLTLAQGSLVVIEIIPGLIRASVRENVSIPTRVGVIPDP